MTSNVRGLGSSVLNASPLYPFIWHSKPASGKVQIIFCSHFGVSTSRSTSCGKLQQLEGPRTSSTSTRTSNEHHVHKGSQKPCLSMVSSYMQPDQTCGKWRDPSSSGQNGKVLNQKMGRGASRGSCGWAAWQTHRAPNWSSPWRDQDRKGME